MATGDDAAAAGMDLVDGATTPANTIDTELNKTRDYIATHAIPTDGSISTAKLANDAVTAAKIAAGAVGTSELANDAVTAAKMDVAAATTGAGVTNFLYSVSGEVRVSTESIADAARLTSGTMTRPVSTTGNGRFGAAWDNNITGTRRAVWMESDGTLGHTASSSRYKKNIAPWAGLTDEQFAALSVVTFQWRDNIDKDDHEEVGMIAEALADAGLEWAIFRDEQGRPEGIHYDRVVLAVIPYVQSLAARVTALES